ncbi:MAG: 23S rRNA (pseudouridine(1915)-N(3))-methyltransferase RlmH [Candidatus Saccharimonadales bacterium]
MKLHVVTVGKPKLTYAKSGWDEYLGRLKRYHDVRVTQLADKHAYDAAKLKETVQGSYVVALVINGEQLSSKELSAFLQKRELEAREITFIIGGPDGLPQDFIDSADWQWSFSKLTFPHDLAMVVLLETLYRASAISAGHPYHK